ncbi:hypothetical protein HDU76_005247 [Blyttiomyces sp. JEL0837]|nr:hypothetical protein HDU76_005247 [Blyttiomyces sp. JEL0837]
MRVDGLRYLRIGEPGMWDFLSQTGLWEKVVRQLWSLDVSSEGRYPCESVVSFGNWLVNDLETAKSANTTHVRFRKSTMHGDDLFYLAYRLGNQFEDVFPDVTLIGGYLDSRDEAPEFLEDVSEIPSRRNGKTRWRPLETVTELTYEDIRYDLNFKAAAKALPGVKKIAMTFDSRFPDKPFDPAEKAHQTLAFFHKLECVQIELHFPLHAFSVLNFSHQARKTIKHLEFVVEGDGDLECDTYAWCVANMLEPLEVLEVLKLDTCLSVGDYSEILKRCGSNLKRLDIDVFIKRRDGEEGLDRIQSDLVWVGEGKTKAKFTKHWDLVALCPKLRHLSVGVRRNHRQLQSDSGLFLDNIKLPQGCAITVKS